MASLNESGGPRLALRGIWEKNSLLLSACISIIFTIITFTILTAFQYTRTLPERPKDLNIMDCMSEYGVKQNGQLTDYSVAQTVYYICYDILRTTGIAKEQSIRDDNFTFQRTENVVLMCMVVAITISGVILAGLQLLASYKLALTGRSFLIEGGQVDLNMHSIALRSSVVGVIILGISFGFFLVFVLYVYTLKDAANGVPIISPPTSSPVQANVGVGIPRQSNPAENSKH
jgi:hypothetical protein